MSNAATPTDSPVIQPLHKATDGTKAMLAKRLAANGGNPKYISPTDRMLTPCTAKISQSKKKHFAKGKPVQLFMKTSDPPTELAEEPAEANEELQLKSETTAVVDDENPF